jgi:hypothetical protein
MAGVEGKFSCLLSPESLRQLYKTGSYLHLECFYFISQPDLPLAQIVSLTSK